MVMRTKKKTKKEEDRELIDTYKNMVKAESNVWDKDVSDRTFRIRMTAYKELIKENSLKI